MSRSNQHLSRRELLALSGAALAGLPLRASWAAPGAAGEAFRIVFFTDVHARVEWETPRALAMAAAAINAQRPELIVAGGDLITDGFQSSSATVAPRWQAYLEMHRALRARVEPALGNHDLVAAIPEDGSPPSADPRGEFRRAFSLERTYRSVGVGGYRLLILDAVSVVGGDDQYHGRIEPDQLRWLATELESIDRSTPIVLASHLPLLTGFYQATEGATAVAPANRVVVNNREVLELFEGHNLLLVLQGHLHVAEMLRWRETTFITGGALCGKWWRGAWHGTGEGFGVLTLRPDRVDWEYHGYGWKAARP